MADDDSFFYVGTTTGDILKMNPKTKLLADTGPVKDKFSLVSRNHQDMIQSSLSFSSAQSFVKEKSVGGGGGVQISNGCKATHPSQLGHPALASSAGPTLWFPSGQDRICFFMT